MGGVGGILCFVERITDWKLLKISDTFVLQPGGKDSVLGKSGLLLIP